MEPITVKYKVLDARAKVPAYATPGAAAADLCAVLDAPLTVAPMQRVLVPTGLAIELPGAHSVALVYARSGLSIKHGLCMANGVGVVDSDYRGELKVPWSIWAGRLTPSSPVSVWRSCALHRCTPPPLCPPRSWATPSAVWAALALPENNPLRQCFALTPERGEFKRVNRLMKKALPFGRAVTAGD